MQKIILLKQLLLHTSSATNAHVKKQNLNFIGPQIKPHLFFFVIHLLTSVSFDASKMTVDQKNSLSLSGKFFSSL